MKKYIPIFLLLFTIFGCESDDDKSLESVCLDDITIDETGGSCESIFLGQNCEVYRLGQKSLSENIKLDFADFCFVRGVGLSFTDSIGNVMTGHVEIRDFSRGIDNISTGFNAANCIIYCLENEEAFVGLKTDRFSLNLILNTRLEPGVDSTNLTEKVSSGFTIWSRFGNSRRVIFNLDVEDYFDEPIIPDTTNIRYHNSITLNSANYTSLYSNENKNLFGSMGNERIYFHPKNGLIAVRDSLGILWTKN